ncbi:DUF5110 domain-containing protein [Chitinophaga sedimenti]|nr:DUF5110 domain-containing protein [Chitinophaga sedimenti]
MPTGSALQYTGEKPADTLTLFVYGGRDAQFSLYEDERINYQYEKGKFSEIPINYNEATKQLTIGDRAGDFPGMLTNRVFRMVYINKQKPKAFNPDSAADKTVQYNGKAQTIQL